MLEANSDVILTPTQLKKWFASISTWMEFVSACPMCSAPVTLGGGMTITNGGLVLLGSGLKKPHASHQSYLHACAQETGDTQLRCGVHVQAWVAL